MNNTKETPYNRTGAQKYLPIFQLAQKTKLFIILMSILTCSQGIANQTKPAMSSFAEPVFEWVVESVDGISRTRIHSGDFLSPHLLQRAYEDNSYRPLWGEKLNDSAWLTDAFNALSELRYDALPTVRYHIKTIETLRSNPEKQWLLDMHLTDAIITAIKDLNGNLLPPKLLGPLWKLKTKEANTLAYLQGVKRGTPVSTMLQSQRPSHAQYAKLREALRGLLQSSTHKPMLTNGNKLNPGDTGDAVYQLAQRLAAEGLINSQRYSHDTSAKYDKNLTKAVQKFQKRRGLLADGILGDRTRAALNTSSADIALKVSLNLQRWRAAPKHFPDSHILVNTAAYKMELHDNGKKALEMDVVVGKRDRQTPSFTETMTSLVLNPNWNIPNRITKEEILPQLREDPDYAKRRGIRALLDNKHVPWANIEYEEFWADEFPYRLQQTAGSRNALGRYKFMFPNPYLVYLHDTPYKKLFSKHNRAYSHGCVRLAEPQKLANYLLAKKGWSESKVKKVVKRGKRRMIALDEPLQVYLMYLTSWVNDKGTLELYPDVYQQDEQATAVIASLLKMDTKNSSEISVAHLGKEN